MSSLFQRLARRYIVPPPTKSGGLRLTRVAGRGAKFAARQKAETERKAAIVEMIAKNRRPKTSGFTTKLQPARLKTTRSPRKILRILLARVRGKEASPLFSIFFSTSSGFHQDSQGLDSDMR
jgi:hypothetical protein